MVTAPNLSQLQAPAGISQAVAKASARTGVDFSYLMHKAAQESSFRADAKASTSSATGLYQFIDKTWLKMVKDHGREHGLSNLAAQIGDDLSVKDKNVKMQILDLRKDPETSAMMAAEFTRENKEQLQGNVGGKIGQTELYMAHFMGAGGASKFLNAMKANPDQVASVIFPKEAAANPGVFTNKSTGADLTLGQIYNRFAAKFDEAPSVVKPINNQDLPKNNSIVASLMSSPLMFDTANLFVPNTDMQSYSSDDRKGLASLDAIFNQTRAQNLAFMTSLIASSLDNPLDRKKSASQDKMPSLQSTAIGI